MNFSILIVGDGNEGKRTYMQKLRSCGSTSESRYLGDEISELNFGSNYGLVCLKFKIANMYEEGHDAEIVMIDLSRANLRKIIDVIPSTDKPRVIVGNKSDLKKATDEEKERIKSKGYEYYEISLKSGSGYGKPLGYLLQKLIGEDFKLPLNYLTDRRTVIFTGKGNQGKSMISNQTPIWIKEDEKLFTVWSNEDEINEEQKEACFVKYQEYIKGY